MSGAFLRSGAVRRVTLRARRLFERARLRRGVERALLAACILFAPVFASGAQAAVSLSATKTATDDNGGSPQPSEVLTYTITVSNSGTTAATNVVLSDPIPASTTFLPGTLTSDDPTDVLVEGDPAQVQIGTLAAAGGGDNDVVITLKVQISAGAANGQVLSNQATITADGPLSIVSDDPSTGAANDPTSVTVVNPLDITLAKTADVASAPAGGNIVYTLSYSNSGSGGATNVSISDFVPSNTTFVSASAGGSLAGGVVSWNIGSLAAGGSGSVQLTVQVNAGVAAGTLISDYGTISFQDDLGNTQDPKDSNTVTTTVTQGAGVAANPDQSGSIKVGNGTNITYTFTVSNTGNGTDLFDLTYVRVQAPFPSLIELIDSTGTVVASDSTPGDSTWDTVLAAADTDGDGNPDTGNIAAGATLTYQFKITKTAGGFNGDTDITSIQATSNFDPAMSDSATFTTLVSPNTTSIAISKSDSPDPVAAGSNITYTIVVTNNGSNGLTGVVASDAIPANTTFVSASAPGTVSGGVVTWSFASLAGGDSETLTLVVQVVAGVPNGTVITNTASAVSNETGLGSPVQATTTTTVQSPVSFATSTKTVNFGSATPGATLTYTISVVNSGITPATGVVVTDTIPASTTYVAGSITGAGADDSGNPTLVWNVGGVAGGATVNLTYRVLVNNPVPAGTTSITNTASIDSNETLPVTTTTATTTITASPNFTLSTKSVNDLNGGLVTTGDTLRYTIVVRNSGNMNATGVVVTDTIPANTTYVAGSISGTGADDSGSPNLVWNVGPLNGAGATTTLSFDVRIADATPGGAVISNVASVDSDQTPPVNTSTASSTVQAGYTGTLTSTATINPGDVVTLTLTDRNLNANPAVVDTVSLTTVNSVTGESETLTYTETGVDTGVFTAMVATVFGQSAGTDNDGAFNVQAGDTVMTDYSDALTATGGSATVTATTTVVSAGVSGTISATATILPAQPIAITVTDADLNTNPAAAETVTVSVNNPTTGETETVTLTETGVNTGVFSGALATSEGSVPDPTVGVLAVAKDDVLTSTYNDAISDTGGPATVTASTTVVKPVLSISKTDSPDPVQAGSSITYTLSYSNTGTADATNVVITDTLPANTSFVSATGGGAEAGGVVTWSVPTLAAGGSGSVDLVVQVASPLANGMLISNDTYGIDSDETTPLAGAAIATTVSSAPVLAISKTGVPDPVSAGSNITYTISYSNTGNENATNVVISDTLPANTTFVSASAPGVEAGGVVSWSLGAVNAGVSGSVTLVVQVVSPLPNGTVISNDTYSIDSDQTAPVAGATETTTVGSAPSLNISKTDAPDPVAAGANITYTISYSNTGNANATSVVISDTVPANTAFVSASAPGVLSGGVVTWAIGALSAGAAGSVTLTVQVASPLANGTVIHNDTYSIDSAETAPTAGVDATTTVTSSPVLGISKSDSPDPVSAGSNITYTISYSNTGNANATSVVISDTVPANTTFVSASAPGALSGGVVTWAIGALNAGASGSVTLTVQVASPLANGTVIHNDTYSIDSAESAPTAGVDATTTVTSTPVLSISKTDLPDPINAGSNLTYTLTLGNSGNADATGVVATDSVPANTTFVSASDGGTEAGGIVTWTIGNLAAGATLTRTLVVQVASPLPNGTILSNSTYSIDSNETAPVSGVAVTTTVNSAPVLSISKADAPDPVAAGANITYTISYSNTGNANATGVVVSDTLPASTTFVSASAPGVLSGGVVTWAMGNLNAGASGSVTLTVQVASPLANGTLITNSTYSIDSNETTPVSGAAISTTVTSAPVLSVSKTDAPDPVAAGANLTYTLSFSNTGNANATGVVVSDTLPANTTFVSASDSGTLSGGVVTWNVGLLAAGSTLTRTLAVLVVSPLPNGTVLSNATYSIDSNETAPVSGATITTTVTAAPVLGISKTDSPDPVAAGSNITYTISYSNTGNENATNVVITDTVPANTTFVSASAPGVEAGGVVTWSLGAVNAGASGTLTLVVQVVSPLPNGTVISNDTYGIDSDQTAPLAGAAVTTTVTSDPILNISKTDSPDPAVAGTDNITYTISYSNTGNSDATGVVISDTLPPGTTFVSASAGGSLSGGVVSWSIGNLPAGGSGSVQLVVSINTPVANGTVITNGTYSIDSNETAAVAGAAATTTVLSSVRFTLGKSDAPDPAAAGSDITYTLSYQNTGTQDATGVVLSDPLPASTTFVSATGGGSLSGGVVTWNIGALSAGASGSVQLVVRVNSPLANGTVITNTGWSIDSNESLPQSGADVTTTVTSAPVLSVSKTDSPDPVTPGNNITYTISYSNAGNENASGVAITDALPANTTFVSATGGGSLAGSLVTWNIGALNAGASGSVQLVVQVASPLPNGTLITNSSFQIDSNETPPVAGTSITTTVSSAPALSITKTDSPDPVNAGSNITYTISYSNTGTADASGVVISDTVPVNTTFVSATGGGSQAGGVVTWSIGALNAGASGSVQMVVQVVTPLANGTLITNGTYSIDSNETGPLSGASITTTVNSVPVLSISKAGVPDPVSAGANITYTLSYTNTGTANASGAVVRDTLPANTTFVSATNGGSLAGGVVSWNIGALAAGASGSVQMVVQVASPLANGTVIANSTYSIDSNETAPVAGTPTGNTVTSSVSLSASKAFTDNNGGSLAPGDIVTYTITVTNSGNGVATNVSLSDPIPASTTLVAGSLTSDDPTDVLAEGNPLTVAIGTLGSDPNVAITFRVRVASPLANGTVISNQATVTADGPISIVSDDPSTGAANDPTSRSVVSAPALSATKTAVDDNGGVLLEGETVTYTLTVTNSGNADATGVSLTDAVPADTTLVPGSLTSDDPTDVRVEGNPLSVAIGTLTGAAGADNDVVITFQVLLDTPLAGGTIISNQAAVTANGGINLVSDDPSTAAANDPTRLTVTASVPALVMTQTVTDMNGGSLNPGDVLRYTVLVVNTGTAAATNVFVSDPVPANTTLMAGSLTSDDPTDALAEGNPVTVGAGTLAAAGFGDNDVVITYEVLLDPATAPGAVIANQGDLSADGPIARISDMPSVNDGLETGNDPADPGDDDPTLSGPVFLGDVLQVMISADVATVRRGEFVLYTVTITNPSSTMDVSNVSLQDRLPVGTNIVRGTVTLDGAPQADPAGTVPTLIPLGTVNRGQTMLLAYRAVVNAGAADGALENLVVAVDSASQRLSEPASVTVTLLEDPEFDLGTIIGKVFNDRDGNGVQGLGEEGIGGVMVAMEDGVYALTDGNGMYHIAAVRPGNRLVKVNRHTLPPNEGLTLPEAQTVTLTPGLLVKVNFGVRKKETQVTWPGRPGTYGIAVAGEKVESEAEVIGNLDDMTAVVNGVQARLPRTRARMDVMSLERNLRIVNGKLDKPASFDLVYPRDRSVREWVFEIFDPQMKRIRGFRGKDLKTTRVVWDGKDAWGNLVQGGAIYQYQLTIEFTDGSLSKSPLRMFGVNRTNVISFELTGASFETNTSILNSAAMSVLAEVAATLRKHPDEKVVIRGHTDSTGTPEWNARLSLMRAEAVQAYLVAAGIDAQRLVVEGRGAADPVAPNDTQAGRARNRRVEIKALLEDTERARTYATGVAAGEGEVVVNGQTVPVEEDGSFRTVVDPTRERGRVYVGIKTEDGGVAAATVTLPTVRILEPATEQKIEIGSREDVIKLMQPAASPDGPRYPTINIPVRGQTEPGNQVFIDGEEVEVGATGVFKTDLPLAVGENVFGVVAIAPNGYTSLVNLAVKLTGVDKKYDVVVVRKPVPRFTLELPPRGAVLSSPNLFVRGKVPPRSSVSVNDLRMGVQPDGVFGGTVRLPEGPSFVQVRVSMADGTEVNNAVPVTVNSNYFFVVALGDATLNKISTEGPVPEKYQDDLFVDGRVALYLKGRIQGKYLLTAGLDSGDGRLSDIGSRLDDRDNSDFYRNLDPDAFYPVYGDASRTGRDINSQGRFYVLLEAPSSTFQWGNYNSGITGNELSSFNRSLYGAKGAWKSLRKQKGGEPLGEAIVFAALPETRSAHDEFVGTGGSLYFLRNKRAVPGSEKVRLEVRDKITGIPVANLTLRNYVDYEIDYAEGRILFRTPVSSVADTSTIISDGLLNGNPVFVVADYEFNDPFDPTLDDNTYGARVKHAVGGGVSVGATYVQEDRPTGTYRLQGGDVTIRAAGDTQVTMEFSQSENEALQQFVSADGGLNFSQKSVAASEEPASAYRFELATGKGRARFTTYLRHIDEGFSSSFSAGEGEIDQQGASAALKLGEAASLNLFLDNREVGGLSTTRTGTLQYQHSLGRFGLTAEARYRDTDNESLPDTSEGIGAIRIDFRPSPKWGLFTRYQDDFLREIDGSSADTGTKRQTTVGGSAQITSRISARAELTSGEQGDSALVGLTTRVDERTTLYGTYTMSPDQAGARTGVTTVGATTALSDRTRLYTEEQFKRNERESGSTQVVGLSTRLSEGLTAGAAFERTNLDGSGAGPDTRRQAASASISFVQPRFKLFSKLETRRDESAITDRDLWLTTNALELKLSRDLTFLGRFSYGVTTDNLTDSDESIFREQSVGVAYRPVGIDWVNFLGRYTRISNLPPDSQTLVRDETTDEVFSFQTVVDLHRRLSLTEKYAVRDRSVDQELLADLKSRMKLWINRFNYHLDKSWDAALEYRTLSLEGAGDNAADGFLFEVNRLFWGHLRVGVGYNFTDFTDNEFSAHDYSARGVFFRLQGKY